MEHFRLGLDICDIMEHFRLGLDICCGRWGAHFPRLGRLGVVAVDSFRLGHDAGPAWSVVLKLITENLDTFLELGPMLVSLG